MNATQNTMTIEKFYIYNGEGKIKYFKTVDDLLENKDFVTSTGYNAVGIDYQVKNSLPGSKDILVKYDGDDAFSVSSEINFKDDLLNNKVLKLAGTIKELLLLDNTVDVMIENAKICADSSTYTTQAFVENAIKLSSMLSKIGIEADAL